MCWICTLAPYQLWQMTTLPSYGRTSKFLVLPWLSGKSLHTSIQSSTKSPKKATPTPRSFPYSLTERHLKIMEPNEQLTSSLVRQDHILGLFRRCPEERFLWYLWIPPWLKRCPSEMAVTPLSRKLGFSSCNFQWLSSPTLLAVLLLNWDVDNSICYCYLILHSSPCEQFGVSLHLSYFKIHSIEVDKAMSNGKWENKRTKISIKQWATICCFIEGQYY